MQKVLNALKKLNIDATDTPELRAQVEALTGQDPDSLTAPQAVQVAETIAKTLNNGALATAQAAAPVQKGKRASRKDRTQDITDALSQLAQTSGREMQAITSPILQGIDQWTDRQAHEVVDAIAEAPNVLLAKIGQQALEAAEAGDPHFFRQQGERLAGIFGFSAPALPAE